MICFDLAPPSDGYKCGECPPGYTGDGETCVDVNECDDGNNGGCDALTTCTNNVGGLPTCGACPTGYKGSGTTGCKKPEPACSKTTAGAIPPPRVRRGRPGLSAGRAPRRGMNPEVPAHRVRGHRRVRE